jgi:hypothetical protein
MPNSRRRVSGSLGDCVSVLSELLCVSAGELGRRPAVSGSGVCRCRPAASMRCIRVQLAIHAACGEAVIRR